MYNKPVYSLFLGLLRLQQLFQAVSHRENSLVIDVKRVADTESCYEMLKTLHNRDEKGEKADIRVFLDIPTERAEDVILRIVRTGC